MHVTKTVTVNRPASEVYEFWHDFKNLPRFMRGYEIFLKKEEECEKVVLTP